METSGFVSFAEHPKCFAVNGHPKCPVCEAREKNDNAEKIRAVFEKILPHFLEIYENFRNV